MLTSSIPYSPLPGQILGRHWIRGGVSQSKRGEHPLALFFDTNLPFPIDGGGLWLLDRRQPPSPVCREDRGGLLPSSLERPCQATPNEKPLTSLAAKPVAAAGKGLLSSKHAAEPHNKVIALMRSTKKPLALELPLSVTCGGPEVE